MGRPCSDRAVRAVQVPQMTIATAQTIFHRFFAKEPLADHDPMDIAQTCLFVAGKSQETPRRLRDVINTVYRYRNPDLPPLEVRVLASLGPALPGSRGAAVRWPTHSGR